MNTTRHMEVDYATYMQMCIKMPWLVDALEKYLTSQPDGSIINLRKLRSELSLNRVPSDSELLEGVMVLKSLRLIDDQHHFNMRTFKESLNFRNGLLSGIKFGLKSTMTVDECIELCMTPPLEKDYSSEIFTDTPNLSYVLSDLIAAARQRIVLCSPFWDGSTTGNVVELLERRLLDGVRVDLLTRDLDKRLVASRIASLQGKYPNCKVWKWTKQQLANGKYSTFHFKALIVDNGTKAYLGSANMTESSMKYSMELGVITTGEVAKKLSDLIEHVLSTFTKYED